MKSILTTIVLMLLCAVASSAQMFDLDSVPQFAYSDEVTLSGSPVRWVVQLPAKSEKSTYFVGLMVYCEATCAITQIRNGTTASTTEVTGTRLNLEQDPVAKFYKNADSTGGTTLQPIPLTAGVLPLTVSAVLRRGSATPQNYGVSVTGASGKARIWVVTAERTR